METKPLLFGLIGFFAGGLLVSSAATAFDGPGTTEPSMSQMTSSLEGKTGDAYDKAFIASMIEHHQSAVDMANLSADRAKHDEIKRLSGSIIDAQESEITKMKQWQDEWNYTSAKSESVHRAH